MIIIQPPKRNTPLQSQKMYVPIWHIGGAAGTVAALEEIPLIGAIKTYDIYVDYSVER